MTVKKSTNKKSARTTERRVTAAQRKLRAHAEAQIEEYLRGAGVENPSELKEEGAYILETGDMQGFAEVDNDDGGVTYLVVARVMSLPSDKDLVVPLQRELLELNSELMGPARFAISGDMVFAVARDVVELMPDADFGRYIDAAFRAAEGAMKRLVKRYGKTTRKRKR